MPQEVFIRLFERLRELRAQAAEQQQQEEGAQRAGPANPLGERLGWM